MAEIYTNGTWAPNPGAADAFVDAWTEFASWASAMPGAGTLRLVRDSGDPDRYVSFGDWKSPGAVRAWKTSAEFQTRLARVLAHVAEFHPSELTLIASASGGAPAAS